MTTTKSNSTETTPKLPHRAIIVTQTTGEKHVLPYGHFLGSEFSASGETLILYFAMDVVMVEGAGLQSLATKLAEMRLRSLEVTEQSSETKYSINEVRVVARAADEKLVKDEAF